MPRDDVPPRSVELDDRRHPSLIYHPDCAADAGTMVLNVCLVINSGGLSDKFSTLNCSNRNSTIEITQKWNLIIFFYLLLLLLLPLASTKHNTTRSTSATIITVFIRTNGLILPQKTYLNRWNQLGRSRERSIVEFFFFLFFFIFHHHITKGWNNETLIEDRTIFYYRVCFSFVYLWTPLIVQITDEELESRWFES